MKYINKSDEENTSFFLLSFLPFFAQKKFGEERFIFSFLTSYLYILEGKINKIYTYTRNPCSKIPESEL